MKPNWFRTSINAYTACNGGKLNGTRRPEWHAITLEKEKGGTEWDTYNKKKRQNMRNE